MRTRDLFLCRVRFTFGSTENSSWGIPVIPDLFLDEMTDLLFSRKFDLVFRDKQLVIHSRECIFNEGLILPGAE